MGNSRSNYERHEDDEQRQRITIGKDFRLVLGQLDISPDLTKGKIFPSNNKQQRHRRVSSSSLNSTIISSSSDRHHSLVTLIQFDIPSSPFDSNELDTHALIKYLAHQDCNGRELTHIFKIPTNITSNNNHKFQSEVLPTSKIVAVYCDQSSTTNELNIETISLFNENELEKKLEEFDEKNIVSIYASSISFFY